MSDDRDPYQVLATLFLGNGASEAHSVHDARLAPRSEASRASATLVGARSSSLSLSAPNQSSTQAPLLRITAAVTGHLPVMAGLWATQFADRVGASDGPTGLIRCERELVHAEILRGGGRHVGVRHGEELSSWLSRAARLVRRWVVGIPTSAEAATVLDPRFANVVLLTSADEAAVAAARAVIASIGDAAQARGAPCALGMVIVGAPPERVQWMADELGAAAPRGVDLPLHGAIQRMDRVESSERYGFEAPTATRIEEILQALESGASDAVDRFAGDGVDGGRTPPRRAASAATKSAAVGPAPVDSPRNPTAEPEIAAARSTSAAPSVAHPMSTHGTPPTSALPQDLAPLIPTLRTASLRCPLASAVELAVDSRGGLHLIAPAPACSSLRTARHWAEVNSELLRRALPALSAAPLRIVERVVSSDATAVEALHGLGIALDLVVESRIGADAHWHHLPLNAAAKE